MTVASRRMRIEYEVTGANPEAVWQQAHAVAAEAFPTALGGPHVEVGVCVVAVEHVSGTGTRVVNLWRATCTAMADLPVEATS